MTDAIATTRKVCGRCGVAQPLDAFPPRRRRTGAPGHRGTCRDCTREAHLAWRIAHREHINASQRQRRAARSTWSPTLRPGTKRYAYMRVCQAIADGLLARPDRCESCDRGGRRIEAHHEDYAKPLDVRWLCCSCHQLLHRRRGDY